MVGISYYPSLALPWPQPQQPQALRVLDRHKPLTARERTRLAYEEVSNRCHAETSCAWTERPYRCAYNSMADRAVWPPM
jgi:hypothetical protein